MSRPGQPTGFERIDDAPTPPVLSNGARYEIGPLLGEGGMGRVYKARDPDLDRFVALKFLRGDVSVLERRFLAEARAQARVVHEHVCRVYEFGRSSQGPFIAMQFVEGKTAQALAGELSLEQRISIVRDVAGAVQAAHDTGLLHRDLKPGNVLVERRGGLFHPYVTDFGLARDLLVPGSTVDGTLLGSPLYMAPEQATGDLSALSVRTDVYGLGAILYELLVGQPPFVGTTSLHALYRTLHQLPVSPRKLDPRIAPALECVALKCLEKDPRRRYGSAGEVAEELRRFQAGESIRARPKSWTRRGLEGALRRRLTSAMVAAAFLLICAVVATRWTAAQRERRTAALSRRFSERLGDIESTLRTAALLPAHDVRREREAARHQLELIRQEMASTGPIAELPGLLALGHGYLALGDYRRAQESLEGAARLSEPSPQDHAALGFALGAQYAEQLKWAERGGGTSHLRAKSGELESTLRGPAMAQLRLAGKARLPDYVEGLIALNEQQYDLALAKAEAAFAGSPSSYQAKKLEGDVWVARAQEQLREGNRRAAGTDLDQARIAFAVAGEIGRSDSSIPRAECGLWIELVQAAVIVSADPRAPAFSAEAACRRALSIDPDDAAALNELSYLDSLVADWLARTGLDGSVFIHGARESAEAAAALDPRDPVALRNIGTAWLEEGVAEEARGGDPRPSYWRCAETNQKLVALEPSSTKGHSNLGVALMSIAFYDAEHGRDPTSLLAQASQALHRALELDPDNVKAAINLSRLARIRARWRLDQGEDPRSAIAEQEARARQARTLDASMTAFAGWLLCHAQMEYAIAEVRDGASPRAAFDVAGEDCHRQRGVGADRVLARAEAWIRTLQAVALADRGLPAGATASVARRLVAESDGPAVAAETLYLSSRIDLAVARERMALGLDPDPFLRRAEESSRLATERSPSWPLVYVATARAAKNRAERDRSRRSVAERDARVGVMALERALALRPHWPEALALKAELQQVAAPAMPSGAASVIGE